MAGAVAVAAAAGTANIAGATAAAAADQNDQQNDPPAITAKSIVTPTHNIHLISIGAPDVYSCAI